MSRARGHAFTLLEVLMALAIFAIALVAIMESVAYQARTSRLAEDTTRAMMLAQDIMAEIRTNPALEQTSGSGDLDGPDAGFSYEYELETTEVEGLSNLRVTVTWSDGRARREQTLETLVAER